jgi:hypothetical protein
MAGDCRLLGHVHPAILLLLLLLLLLLCACGHTSSSGSRVKEWLQH